MLRFKPICLSCFSVTVLLCTLPHTGYSQVSDSVEITRKIPRALQAVEVRSARASALSPFAKTELSQEDIARQNLGQDLPVLLQLTPSAVANSDAGAGVGYTGLRIRGTDGTRINVTLNGVPVNDAESQGTFFVNLPDLASSANSIQIQRGAGSSTNGSGAFGATISVSNMEQRSVAGGEFNFSAGSFNTQKYTLRAGTGLLKSGLSVDVRLSKISSDGYIMRAGSDLRAGQIVASYLASRKTKLRFQVLSGSEKTGQAWNGVPEDSLKTNRRLNELGQKPDGTYYDNQTDNYSQTYYQLFADHSFNSRWSGTVGVFLTRGKGFYEEYKQAESFADYNLPDVVTPAGDTFSNADIIRRLWLDNYFYGGVYGLQYAGTKFKLNIGGSVSQYSGLHYGQVKWAAMGFPADYSWYRNDAMKNDFNQYAKAEWKLGQKLLVYGEAQLRLVSYFMNGFRKNPALHPAVNYAFFNPKAGISYLFKQTEKQQQRLYASIALAAKEPNRDDFEASPTALPKPEKLTDIEAGYEWKSPKLAFSANYYLMMYKDQLVVTGKINDVGAYTRVNVDKSYRTGIELAAAVQAAPWLNIAANATFAQNKIAAFDEYADDYDNGGQTVIAHKNTDIAFSPGFIGAASVAVKPFVAGRCAALRSFELALMNKTVSRQFLDNTQNDARSIAPYSFFDLRVRCALVDKAAWGLNLTAAAYNIFNAEYAANGYNYAYLSGGSLYNANYFFPQAGTNFLAGIGLRF